MNKIYLKLIAMSLALILSVLVVLMSTYAWLVLSNSPAVTGIHVAIGGGNTILMAPNIREVEDGSVYCYPGHFSDKLNFGQESSYDYLKELCNLSPVSTSNGIEWFLPVYYSVEDKEVQEGWVASGTLKDVSEFHMESELEHANLSPTEEKKEKITEGSYVYLDFWVVAPGGDFTLRVSTDVEDPESTDSSSSGGSFVIDLMEPEETENGYVLKQPERSGAGAVRVGFLANSAAVVDDTMKRYSSSPYADDRFIKLKGVYKEPEEKSNELNVETTVLDTNRFLIYEPNCDLHPPNPNLDEPSDLDGYYVETKPLAWVNGKIRAQSAENLTAQKKSVWSPAQGNAGSTLIEQIFQGAARNRNWNDKTADEVMDLFYNKELQGQISPYVNNGGFIKSTKNLNAHLAASNNGVLGLEFFLSEDIAGATEDEDVYIIKLERNVPQRIRMFIWLEGQDVDCVDSVNSSSFAVNIEFAGGSK